MIMWQSLIPIISSVLERVLPDPGAAAEAKIRLLELAQQGELAKLTADTDLAKGQIEINKAEADGTGYKANWRPTIGYVCAAALAYTYILNPLLLWAAAVSGSGITPPDIVIDEHLWELMMGMLGLAGWRTMDKVKGK